MIYSFVPFAYFKVYDHFEVNEKIPHFFLFLFLSSLTLCRGGPGLAGPLAGAGAGEEEL